MFVWLFVGLDDTSSRHRALVERFCARFVSLPFDDRAADTYATIRADLTATGQLIGPNDLVIVAIAVANTAVLVTHNAREFSRGAGPMIDDWEASTSS